MLGTTRIEINFLPYKNTIFLGEKWRGVIFLSVPKAINEREVTKNSVLQSLNIIKWPLKIYISTWRF